MTKKPSDKRGDSFSIPESDLEQYRNNWRDHVSPFPNFARVNLDELLLLLERLEKPERRVLMSMMKRMHTRNMIIISREEFREWLKCDYGWYPEYRHLSTYLQSLRDKLAIKELCRVTIQTTEGRRKDIITYCINPYLIFKGKSKLHIRLIVEWDDDDIVPPKSKQTKRQQDHTPKG